MNHNLQKKDTNTKPTPESIPYQKIKNTAHKHRYTEKFAPSSKTRSFEGEKG